MKILQTPTFKRKYKKLSSTQQSIIKETLVKICNNPTIGTVKKADLANVRVHKFKIHNQEYLLAYSVDLTLQQIILLTIGSHENFYRNLKR